MELGESKKDSKGPRERLTRLWVALSFKKECLAVTLSIEDLLLCQLKVRACN